MDRDDNHVRMKHLRNAASRVWVWTLRHRQESLGRYPSFTPRWLHGQLVSSLRSHYIRPIKYQCRQNLFIPTFRRLSLLHAPSAKSSLHGFYWIVIFGALQLLHWIMDAQAAILWIYVHIGLNNAVALSYLCSASKNCARGASMASCGIKRGFPAI